MSKEERYFKIRINSIHPDFTTTFDLFVFINNHHVLYLRAGDKMDKAKLQTFVNRGTDVFYVREGERHLYKAYVHDCLNKNSISPERKAKLLRESSMSLVEELFESPNLAEALSHTKEVVEQFIDFMNSEAEAFVELIGLSSHDFYTYNHSLDVSIYSLGLAQSAGYTDHNELMQIGTGGLLHDIGKRYVDTSIICKKGALTDEEWEQMKMHPTWGLQIVSEFAHVNDAVKACVFEHHENFLGNGYPRGIRGEEIHPMARIVAISDTYDALTTKRSYNDPMPPTQALNLMKDRLKARFDPVLLEAFYSVLFKMNNGDSIAG
ncbi:MAG: HD family phosphohydrolase [Bdellovibrionales bacterium CG10_big_fil_rev_8_21_14_0_10_45_34]|nr:MAG: HD family phosphohydrolase [Bdellovibrionales bacterium CG10_big_fil_rev_8_21_14_0_10_45_34]